MREKKESRPLGRPMKGKDRRMQIGVYVAGSVIDMMDEYVFLFYRRCAYGNNIFKYL